MPSQRVKRKKLGFEPDMLLAVRERKVPIVLLPNKRARRIIMRIDHCPNRVVVVLPHRASKEDGRKFALLHRGWIEERIDQLPEPLPFAQGTVIPLLGSSHVLHHAERRPPAVWRDGRTIIAHCPKDTLAEHVEAWLRETARREITRLAHEKAAQIDRTIGTIRISDPKTRWGSCSATARLSFSWRLILAPRYVLDYVVAHEVAHLKEMNHSARFWKLTDSLTSHTKAGRQWLQTHGWNLHAFGG